MDTDRTEDDVAVAAPIRAACADLHPSDALRAAVLLGLSTRPPAPSPSRRWLTAVAAAGVAAAIVVGAVLWPRRDARLETPQPDALPPVEAAADRDAERSEIARQRAANRAVYETEFPRMNVSKGKWVAIAAEPPPNLEGAFKAIVLGETLDDVAKFAPHAKHRYVFRVGGEGDVETFASTWYAPRFAGHGLVNALGISSIQGGDGITLRKGGITVTEKGPTPFPRVRVAIDTPDREPVAAAAGDASATELWLGSVGPTLMLTPEDGARLSLARWEVPGVETVMGVPCRRVLVRVALVGLPGDATVVGAVPDVPYERLVALSRSRHSFWQWPDSLRGMLDLPGEGDARGQWLVFGNDRVLGRGPTPETAVTDADDRMKDVVYQRWVVRWPMLQATTVARPQFEEPVVLAFGGAPWMDARRCAEPEAYAIAPVDDATWVSLGLHRTETDGQVVAPMLNSSEVPFGREAFVRARVGSTLGGKIEEIAASRFVLVVEDPTMSSSK